MNREDGYQLHYLDETGKVCGGLEGCIGEAPPINGVPTQLVMVDTSPEVNALMKADEQYIHVEDIVEATPIEV